MGGEHSTVDLDDKGLERGGVDGRVFISSSFQSFLKVHRLSIEQKIVLTKVCGRGWGRGKDAWSYPPSSTRPSPLVFLPRGRPAAPGRWGSPEDVAREKPSRAESYPPRTSGKEFSRRALARRKRRVCWGVCLWGVCREV